MSYLTDLVIRKVDELGREAAADFFSVKPDTIDTWKSSGKVSLAAVEKVFVEPSVESDKPAAVEVAEWEGKKVALLCPWYRDVEAPTAACLLRMVDRAKMTLFLSYNDAFISHARDTLAKQFFESGIEWSLWIDSDVVFPVGNADWFNNITGFGFPEKFAGMHVVNRLLSHGKTLVGGVYFGRSPKGKPMFSEGFWNPQEASLIRSVGPQDKIKPTKWVATGCLLAHKSVYHDIVKKYPQLKNKWFSASEHDLVTATKEALAVLNDGSATAEARLQKMAEIMRRGQTASANNSQLGTGEDVIFCHRATSAGHQSHVDLGLILGHIGNCVYGPKNTLP